MLDLIRVQRRLDLGMTSPLSVLQHTRTNWSFFGYVLMDRRAVWTFGLWPLKKLFQEKKKTVKLWLYRFEKFRVVNFLKRDIALKRHCDFSADTLQNHKPHHTEQSSVAWPRKIRTNISLLYQFKPKKIELIRHNSVRLSVCCPPRVMLGRVIQEKV